MSDLRIGAGAVVLLLAAFPLLGQQQPLERPVPLPPQAQNPTGRPSSRHAARQPRQEPCWQQAGISQAAIEQRRSIQESVKSQVAAICANSSLTQQQRRQQIRQVHEQARQQMESLITPQQMQALRACQQARSRAHGGGFHGSGGGGRGTGPCGEMPEPPSEPKPEPKS